jgi:SOS-response transcriptional repressor LexA
MVTQRQREVLRAFQKAKKENRPPPTRVELCAALGVKSVGTINEHVDKLLSKQMLEYVDGAKSRNLRLTDRAKRHLALCDEIKEP